MYIPLLIEGGSEMTRDWFCQIAGRQYGPLTLEQLQRMARSGQLPADAPVRQGEEGTWYYASTMPGIFPDSTAEAAPPASQGDASHEAPPAAAPASQLAARGTPPAAKARAQSSRPQSPPADSHVPTARPLGAATGAKKPSDSASFTGTHSVASPDAPRTVVARPQAKPGPVAAAIPMGAVAAQPSAIPHGRPVIPQGVAVSPHSAADSMIPTPIVSANTATKAGKGASSGKRKAGNNKKALLIGGGATVGGLVIFAVAIAMIFSKSPPKKELSKEVASVTEVTADDDAAGAPGNSPNVLEKSVEKKKFDGAKEPVVKNATKAKVEGVTAAALSGPEKVLKAIPGSAWKDLAKVSGTTVKSDSQHIKLQILSAWFGGSAKAEEGEEKKSGGNRVYVEVTVTNLPTSAAPLNYTSWNGKFGTNAQSVVVADDQFRTAAFTPLSKTPEVSRQTSPVRLQPGKSVTDVLVFELAQAEFEFLYLALPFNAVGSGDRPFAFKIPKSNILPERPKDVPDQIVKTPGSPQNPVGDAVGRTLANGGTEELAETVPAAAPPAMKSRGRAMADDDDEKIPSLAEINKQIEAMQQKDSEAKKKARAAEGNSP